MTERLKGIQAPGATLTPSWTFLELLDEEDLWWEEWDEAMYATYGHMTFPERMKAISERFIEIQKELYSRGAGSLATKRGFDE